MMTNATTSAWVHEAWANGPSWKKVIQHTRKNGIKMVTTSAPITAVADDMVAMGRALERVDDPAVPAGHAYPGAVVGGSRSDRVKALVHAAALAPDERDALAH